MMSFDFSKTMLDELPFSDIALDKSEMKRLRRCSKGKILAEDDDLLVCYGFAQHEKSCTGGSTMPKPNGYISITNRGQTYLNYRRLDDRRYFVPQVLSLVAVLASVASLVISVLGFISPAP